MARNSHFGLENQQNNNYDLDSETCGDCSVLHFVYLHKFLLMWWFPSSSSQGEIGKEKILKKLIEIICF